MMPVKLTLTVACVLVLVSHVNGHARLIDPPGRSTLWRFVASNPLIAPYDNKIVNNYQDHSLFCGGFSRQKALGGKCGVCGDAYDGVRENEAGGKYGLGIIVKKYAPGTDIIAKVDVTAHHKGYFEFRLCPWNDPLTPVTQECLDRYILKSENSTQYMLPNDGSGIYDVPLKLPDGVECDQCVIQWRYHTGNSWGCGKNNKCCTGCGPQEEFYACADVAIGDGEVYAPPEPGVNTDLNMKPSKAPSITSSTVAPNWEAQPPWEEDALPGDSESCGTLTTTTTTRTVGSTLSTEVCQIYETGIKAKDCNSFYMCVRGNTYEFTCPENTVFNAEFNVCDHPCDVPIPCGTKK